MARVWHQFKALSSLNSNLYRFVCRSSLLISFGRSKMFSSNTKTLQPESLARHSRIRAFHPSEKKTFCLKKIARLNFTCRLESFRTRDGRVFAQIFQRLHYIIASWLFLRLESKQGKFVEFISPDEGLFERKM